MSSAPANLVGVFSILYEEKRQGPLDSLSAPSHHQPDYLAAFLLHEKSREALAPPSNSEATKATLILCFAAVVQFDSGQSFTQSITRRR